MFRHRHNATRAQTARRRGGFTLLEALVTVGLAVLVLSVYTAMLTGVYYLSRAELGIQATNFVQESLDALRTVDFEDLTVRTDGRLLGYAFTRGNWKVVDNSGDQILRLETPTTAMVDETGLAVLPGSYRGSYTVTADVLVDGSAPTGWGGGLGLQYRDSENHYRFRIAAGGIAFDEVSQGTVTTLWSQSATYTKDTWYTLEVTVSGNDYTLKRNGVLLTTVTSYTFESGDVALMSLNESPVSFDDVTVTGDEPGSWTFESEELGSYPDDWRRLSPFDLPDGNATLTIEEYLGQADMKKATVYITWTETNMTKSAGGAIIIIDES